jgi:chaperonin GroES
MEYPRAILNKIVVRREDPEEITKGGIIIPETAKGKPTVGYVVAIGPDVDPQQLDVGDKVFFDQYVGTNFSLNGIEYVAMLMKDVLCVLEEGGKGVEQPEEIEVSVEPISNINL